MTISKLQKSYAKVITYLISESYNHPRNYSKFKDKWAVDPDEKDSTESPIQTFDAYLNAASKKSFWIDGLLLKGLAENLTGTLS